MDPARVDFHPRAIADARGARRWYARRSGPLSERFLAELGRVIARIANAPGRWPLHRHGTRVCRLARFPYTVVYHYSDDVVRVIAVAHAGRDPDYWRRRLS